MGAVQPRTVLFLFGTHRNTIGLPKPVEEIAVLAAARAERPEFDPYGIAA
jgi:hypothetical protein